MDNIHLGIHTVEVKLVDKNTKLSETTIKTKIEVLTLEEWISQGLDEVYNSLNGPEFTGTDYNGCTSVIADVSY